METPLNKAHALSSLTNNNVYFKREDMQPVFSFKIRGAYNRIVSAHPVPAQCAVPAYDAAYGKGAHCTAASNGG